MPLDLSRWRYRISVNNNFRKKYAYLDYKKLGVVVDFTAFSGDSSGTNEGETLDSIGIYKNYKTVAIVKSKAEAVKELDKLINECPNEAKKDFEEYSELLFRGLK